MWLSFITDFTLWIVMQMLYFGGLTCDSTLEQMTIVTIILRWVMIVLYFVIPINHLCDKIHQENKRKFGRNPYKDYKLKAKQPALFNLFGMESGSLEPEERHTGTPDVGAVATADVDIEMQQPANFASSSSHEHTRAAPSTSGPEYQRAQHVV